MTDAVRNLFYKSFARFVGNQKLIVMFAVFNGHSHHAGGQVQ
jgi:hypothetical protein